MYCVMSGFYYLSCMVFVQHTHMSLLNCYLNDLIMTRASEISSLRHDFKHTNN